MNISAPFIYRPIATALLMAAVLLLGLVAYPLLPVASLPNVNFPTIQVQAQLPGADPQTMASSVATPLEQQFSFIPGVTQLTSSSALGVTQLTVQFDLSRDIDSAATDVLAAINAASPNLPQGIPYPPTIRKVNPADTPIMVLALTSDSLPLTTVDAYAENILVPKISQISGVGLVGIGGQQKPAVRVQVDPQALANRGIGLEDVRAVLGQANVDLPKGTLNGSRQTYTLNTNDQLVKPDQYEDLIVAYRNGAPVRIRDIGRAVSGPENNLMAGWYNDRRGIFLTIQRQPGANVIETVDRIKALLPQLQASIPPAIKLDVLSDRTQTIRASVADVQFTLLLTVALVVMVIFLFLRNLWATVIPAVTVPLSLVGTLAALYVLGYSLDNLSLMALSIAVGFVVDDAVVVIENIVRHLEEGLSPMDAALKGSAEIGFTIISITLSLIAVFIPLFLMGGYVGKLFQEFAITVSVSLVLSLFVSLTLTPMMCSRLLKPPVKTHGRLYMLFEHGFDGLLGIYERGLRVALRHRFPTLLVMLGTIGVTGYLYVVIPKGFFPQQDTGMIVGIAKAAQDISYPAMADRMQAAVKVLLKDPAIASVGIEYWAGRLDGHAQPGAPLHRAETARPARCQRRPGDQSPARSAFEDRGHHALHASGAGHHGRGPSREDAVSVHADGRRLERAQSLGSDLPGEAESPPSDHGRGVGSGKCRPAAQRDRQSRSRVELRHPASNGRQYPGRRLRSAHRLDHIHAAEPVPRRARGRPALPDRPLQRPRWRSTQSRGQTSTGGPSRPARANQPEIVLTSVTDASLQVAVNTTTLARRCRRGASAPSRKSAPSCAGCSGPSGPTGRQRRSCCAPTATIAARRSSTGVAPTGLFA